MYDPDRINGSTLTRDSDHGNGAAACRHCTSSERRSMTGLEPGREDIILAGAVIVQEIMERWQLPDLLVSDWGLREGIVFDLYETMITEGTINGADQQMQDARILIMDDEAREREQDHSVPGAEGVRCPGRGERRRGHGCHQTGTVRCVPDGLQHPRCGRAPDLGRGRARSILTWRSSS